jgi:hypothetical protein
MRTVSNAPRSRFPEVNQGTYASERPTQERENDAVSGTIVKHASNPFEPPKAEVGTIESEFRSSIWKKVILACFLGFVLLEIGFVVPLLIFLNLNPTLILAIVVIGFPLGVMAFGNVLQIWALRGVSIRACREGVLIRLTPGSEIPEVASPQGAARTVWSFLNGRDTRFPVVGVSWGKIAAIGVTRFKGRRTLVMQVCASTKSGEPFYFVVVQSDLSTPVRRIAESLNTYFHQPDRRAALSAWDDADAGRSPITKIS